MAFLVAWSKDGFVSVAICDDVLAVDKGIERHPTIDFGTTTVVAGPNS
jgi:hypothetical protein